MGINRKYTKKDGTVVTYYNSKESIKKYRQSEKGKATKKRYETSEKGKAIRRKKHPCLTGRLNKRSFYAKLLKIEAQSGLRPEEV